MRILIAPDSFKGSLGAPEVARAVAAGVRAAESGLEVMELPMADGGQGTVEAMVAATGGRLVEVEALDPLGRAIRARYGLLGDGQTAVIEMAAASGLTLLKPEERDPRLTTTYGTGQLIRAALDRGVRRIIVGIGGSATNDGGAGAAQALGVRFLDQDGNPLPPGGAGLARLERIDPSGLDPRLQQVEVLVACDVTNPLCGPRGASAVYGPQKGATPEMVRELDAALAHFAAVVRREMGVDVAGFPGSGAGGGLSAGLVAFAGGKIRRGFELVAEATRLAEQVARADLIITGEGRTDRQTLNGKTVWGVAQVARQYGKPVVALSGSLGEGAEELLAHGVTALFSCIDRPMGLEEAMAEAPRLLAAAAQNLVRLWLRAQQG